MLYCGKSKWDNDLESETEFLFEFRSIELVTSTNHLIILLISLLNENNDIDKVMRIKWHDTCESTQGSDWQVSMRCSIRIS